MQFIALIGTYLTARSVLLWSWAIFSFIPPLIVCFAVSEKKYVIFSLILFFVSQQAIYIFANPNWGITFGSDAINDFQTASLISELSHFDLGKLGYASRLSYSYYPMLHLFSVSLSAISGITLMSVALYLVPFLNAVLTVFILYYLNHELFGLDGFERNLATLAFEIGFVYTTFDSQFVREAFAFPIVLMFLWVFVRLANRQNSSYGVIAFLLILVTTFAHQISSFVCLLLLALITICFNVFRQNNKLNRFLLLTAVIISSYTAFVAFSFSSTQVDYALEGLRAIFDRGDTITVMRSSSVSSLYLSIIYYMILAVFVIIAGVKLLKSKKKDWLAFVVLVFFLFVFVVCVLLRLSTSANPWGWTYYMALRGTIWAFIGLSVSVSIGMVYAFKLKSVHRLRFIGLLLVVCLLAAGKFSQYPSLITDQSSSPINYTRYIAAIWLKEEVPHGSIMLIAPYTSDNAAFEASRGMAPYAYLKEYFLDNTGHTFDKFSGYVPFVGEFFNQYRNSNDVSIIYSNGETQIGYKSLSTQFSSTSPSPLAVFEGT